MEGRRVGLAVVVRRAGNFKVLQTRVVEAERYIIHLRRHTGRTGELR